MRKITQISGKTIPLNRDNVDTDLIIPAEYLTSTAKKGYGKHLFKRLRESDINFVFNQDKFSKNTILITQENFGCGSSREHAVWALQEAGIQAVIAVSFADIFFSNSCKNGLLLITQPKQTIDKMLDASQDGTYTLNIDIEHQKIHANDEIYAFEMEAFVKHCFVNGMDDLSYLLAHKEKISLFKKRV
jgi:3-isopropylmalate/(R)-2-methylmalate dehydratase small subunit